MMANHDTSSIQQQAAASTVTLQLSGSMGSAQGPSSDAKHRHTNFIERPRTRALIPENTQETGAEYTVKKVSSSMAEASPSEDATEVEYTENRSVAEQSVSSRTLSSTYNANLYTPRSMTRTSTVLMPRPSKFFEPGRVLTMMVTEPLAASATSSKAAAIIDGHMVYSKVRTVVVLKNERSSCIAVPVYTHQRQGVAAPYVDPATHGVIYSGSIEPELSPAEKQRIGKPKLEKPAIRVNSDARTDEFDALSRLDYSKFLTVDHNRPVKTFGKVHEHYLDKFIANSLGTFTRPQSGNLYMQEIWRGTLQHAEENASARLSVPQPRRSTVRRVAGKEDLGQDFKRREQRYFVPGRVFRILYSEPAHPSIDDSFAPFAVEGRCSSWIYQKVRSFVVLKSRPGSCTALRISTHEGKGLAADDVNLVEHGVIYTDRDGPLLSSKEREKIGPLGELVNKPIRVLSDRPQIDRLDPMARIDYRKLYNIEQYCPVKNIGKIHDQHFNDFMQQSLRVSRMGMPSHLDTPVAQPLFNHSHPPMLTGGAAMNGLRHDILSDRMSAVSVDDSTQGSPRRRPPDYHPDVYVGARRMKEVKPDIPWPELLLLANIVLQQKREQEYGVE